MRRGRGDLPKEIDRLSDFIDISRMTQDESDRYGADMGDADRLASLPDPYYQSGGMTIYHADCLPIAAHVKADVIVSDPPYGMSYVSGWSKSTIASDGNTDARDLILSRWQGPAIIFGKWSCARPENIREILIWDKGEWPGMGDLSFPWGPSHEEIYVIGTGFTGSRMGSVIRKNRIGGNGLHPTEKPLEVMSKLIERCPPGIIFDPFMGSGSSIVAAKILGRRAIGIEIEERYCEIAARRLSQSVFDFPNELADNRLRQDAEQRAGIQSSLLEEMGREKSAKGDEDLR